MENDEQVVVVDVDLRALIAGEDVLEVEGVEVEVLLQPAALERPGVLDVDPAQVLGVDLLDVGGLGLSRRRRERRRAAQNDAAVVLEGSASFWLIMSAVSQGMV